MKQNHSLLIYLLIVLCFFGYIIPWVIVSTSPLTLGAYDLAEWTTIHPSQPATSPPLNIAFILRLQLVLITLLVGLNAQTDKARLLSTVLIIPLAIAQLPPLDFLTSESGNINYQQQFVFASISLFVGYMLTFFKPTRFVPIVIVTLSAVGIVTSIVGLNEAQKLYTMSFIEHTSGNGIILLCAGYVGVGLTSLQSIKFKQMSINGQPPLEPKQGSI